MTIPNTFGDEEGKEPQRFVEISDSDYDYLAGPERHLQSFRLRSDGMENVLELTHLKKYYGQTRAVEDVTFSVKPGEVVVIIGPKRRGEIHGAAVHQPDDRPHRRAASCSKGTDMAQVKREKELKAIRRRIGMIFQSFNLVYRLSVFQNVLHGRLGYMSTPNAVLGRYSEADKEKALELLRMIGLEGMLYTKRPGSSPAARSSGWASPGP